GSSEEIVVRVPAGIADGAKLHVAGKGEGGGNGGPAGSLYLQIKVMNDPIFSRDGDDIIVERAIPFSEAALGTSLDVPTLEGSKRIRVPAGIQPGTRIRLAGFGFPRATAGTRGDLYTRITIAVPVALTDEQRRLLQELGEQGL
ncbi:MAG TPA: DnaJ C-terminal domain-containing protein, partial [Geobacterales bacterium]|nr:DnaJ C-terminal domain-containing protein [Geobacterales bacterium]